ncbi:MAG TPA: TIM barrel protein [Steroidobacteraceae bacterium]|nr:TIM barrel protein [Steroidobacteraceae bacterium]
MDRRNFLLRSGALAISVAAGAAGARHGHAGERLGMGTVLFRNRFPQTRPASLPPLQDPLTLLDVPAYYRGRFGIRQLEFWSPHFESLDRPYLRELRDRVRRAGAELVNVQVDADYDLASTDEAERRHGLDTVRQWIDAAALLGSRAVRVNPGRASGSVERSIASMREVNRYCVAKRLPLLIENHFGIEMDPDVHLAIREGAGPGNVYTDPDFGNYPVETMWDSLAKILPFAWAVSAKAVDFDARGEHVSYDFDRCVRLCESAGFRGVYLVEQWSRREQDLDPERIGDWLLARVRANIRTRISD